MSNERPLRIYRNRNKVYFKTTDNGRHLIKVPQGQSIASGSSARDLYNINIQYGPRRAVRGRAKNRKPEVPLFTKPVAPTNNIRVVTGARDSKDGDPKESKGVAPEEGAEEPVEVAEPKRTGARLGEVEFAPALPTRFLAEGAVARTRIVPEDLDEADMTFVPGLHHTPEVLDDEPAVIGHTAPPNKFEEDLGIGEYKNDGDPYVPPGEEEPITAARVAPHDPYEPSPPEDLVPIAVSDPEFNPSTLKYKDLDNDERSKLSARLGGTTKTFARLRVLFKSRYGEAKYKTEFENWWRSSVKSDRADADLMVGHGDSDGRDVLTNGDIKTLFKTHVGRVVDVVPSDCILTLLPKVSPKTKQFYFVQNYAKSTSDGTKDGHWMGWVLDRERATCYFYNSLARPAKQSWLKDVKQLIMKMDPVHMWKYKTNRVRNQSLKTSDCGWFVSHFIHEMMGSGDWRKATFYDHPSLVAEKELDRFQKKWGYI